MAQEAYLAEIRHFAFGFAPKGWAQCNGQLMSVNQNQALFSLLGTTYGGDGRTTFGLPNLQGNVSISSGTMTGGPSYNLGQVGGSASVTLTTDQMPTHQHVANGSATQVSTAAPGPSVLPGTFPSAGNYSDNGSSVSPMGAQTVGNAGGGQSHENRQPYTVLNICICLQGIFPSRN